MSWCVCNGVYCKTYTYVHKWCSCSLVLKGWKDDSKMLLWPWQNIKLMHFQCTSQFKKSTELNFHKNLQSDSTANSTSRTIGMLFFVNMRTDCSVVKWGDNLLLNNSSSTISVRAGFFKLACNPINTLPFKSEY